MVEASASHIAPWQFSVVPPMISDQELLKSILLRPNHPVVRILDGSLRLVTPAVAILMLKSGTYEWCGSTRRVRKMRQIDKPRPWVECYRTTEAPTIQPSIEWGRPRNTGGLCRGLQSINA